eukprot:16436138-Heterocapsa_arctica.AAC.1
MPEDAGAEAGSTLLPFTGVIGVWLPLPPMPSEPADMFKRASRLIMVWPTARAPKSSSVMSFCRWVIISG